MRVAINRRRWMVGVAAAVTAPPLLAQAFDPSHSEFNSLLRKHVVTSGAKQSSRVRYAGFKADRAALQSYRDSLTRVSESAFLALPKAEQMAFLINAYNAFTIELILTKYPELASIKDIGSLFSSPWKLKWIALLGNKLSLDDIEHGLLRERGRFNDPRVHFAVNCASIGCPSLREEAYVAQRLDAQLDEQALRFMSDRTRNRYDAANGRLEVSQIFDWYGDDFKLGHRGIATLPAFLARYAESLADAPGERERVRSERAPIKFLAYDWRLNDAS